MVLGGGLVVSLSTALVSGLASWAVVRLASRRGDRHGTRGRGRPLAARFAAGAIGAARRRRLSVLSDDEHRALGARR